jgi:hypothetical protein
MPFLATVVHGMNATNYCRRPAECQLIIALPDACSFLLARRHHTTCDRGANSLVGVRWTGRCLVRQQNAAIMAGMIYVS